MTIYYIHQFLFGYYPYICFTIFILGSILRYKQDQYTWKADSSQLLRKNGMNMGSNLFHVSIIIIFLGHLVGLLTPEYIYHNFITSAMKQTIAMIIGGVAGILCFIGMTILIKRRLCDPRIRATSKPSDIFILLILYVQLILGLATIPFSANHPDASSMIALANWAQHIITFRPDATFVVDQAWIFKLHLVLGMTIFLVFPFTRLVHIFSGITAFIKYTFRTGYQIVRRRG